MRTSETTGTTALEVKVPSTLGIFLRSFRWRHVRHLDRVSRELLARALQVGAKPSDGSLAIDLNSTGYETYGLVKDDKLHRGYAGERDYHSLLVVSAGNGETLLCRLPGAGPTRLRVTPTFFE